MLLTMLPLHHPLLGFPSWSEGAAAFDSPQKHPHPGPKQAITYEHCSYLIAIQWGVSLFGLTHHHPQAKKSLTIHGKRSLIQHHQAKKPLGLARHPHFPLHLPRMLMPIHPRAKSLPMPSLPVVTTWANYQPSSECTWSVQSRGRNSPALANLAREQINFHLVS